ncbi:hypothetical protein HMPREF9075_02221 [Capnocytophaga sp. oral taxon 332 str. F0381]|jgi:hypothetical protein|nr:hypothetical protein HMPREF9075_02221 [Capnocytophaga sp. oral taxon 332 str. F0381]
MRLAINYTIKALLCLQGKEKDISEKAIGWHGLDILKKEKWKNDLYIKNEHKKYGFSKWVNKYKFDKSIFESVLVYEGKGYLKNKATLFYKSTIYAFKLLKTGMI